jgi:two-component system, chemotaxis family, chemotaxis protein CheY
MQRILVVDDEPTQLTLIKTMLAKIGYCDVDTSSAPAGVPDRILRQSFSLLLLDWYMPGMDGVEILRRLRSSKPNFPIIMVTSEGRKEKVVEAISAGVTDYLVKPFHEMTLKQKVDRILGKKS